MTSIPPNPIRVLPPDVAAKIAAGEVVERPASVVRELVENSMDAGADRIAVDYDNGGRTLIRITDNGGGIAPEDIQRACLSYATSKITGIEDLDTLHTMGFRGEALYAISSVSRMTITSRTADRPDGRRLKVFGGQGQPVEVAGSAAGTVIEVRDLFFNTPARLKFMKRDATEAGHINQTFNRLALVRPDIHFELAADGARNQLLPAADTRRQRIGDIFGHELARELIEIDFADEYLRVEAWMAPPKHSRSTSTMQYTFLNGRFIRDKVLTHAISAAYQGLMVRGRYPVAFLFLTIDPAEVDVNVHPAKLEVRFRRPSLIGRALVGRLGRELVASGRLVPEVSWDQPARRVESAPLETTPLEGLADRPPDDRLTADSRPPGNGVGGGSSTAFAVAGGVGPWEMDESDDGDRSADYRHAQAPVEPHRAQQPTAADRLTPPGARYRVFQIHDAYIIEETPAGVAIIDQHALHERILFEELKEKLEEATLPSQSLLAPDVVDAPQEWVAGIDEHTETFRRLGFELSAFGPSSVAVHAYPQMLKPREVRQCVVELLEGLLGETATGQAGTEVFDRLLHTMACRAAVKAGDPLTDDEMSALLAKRDRMNLQVTCPHGRPNTIRLGVVDLEKQFRRT